MIDLFTKILSSVVGQMGGGDGKLSKIEKDLARKFDALEAQARKDSAKRWAALFVICALLGAGAFFAYRAMNQKVKVSIDERLKEEFSSVAMQQTIEDSAKKYTELQLKEYVDRQLAEHYRVAKLEAMAKQDSRKAYEDLEALSNDAKFRDEALFSISVIQKRYASLAYPFEPQGTLADQEGSSVQMKLDPAAESIDRLRPRLSQLAQESQKNYLVPDFIRFLRESDSLGGSVGVCRILIHNYGEQAGDYDFDKWIQYLEGIDKSAVKVART